MLNDFKIVVEIIESAITSLALVVGGYWTYRRFVKQRTESPQGRIRIRRTHAKFIGDEVILTAECELGNTGKTLIPLRLVKLIVRSVDSTSVSNQATSVGTEYVYPWPELARREWRWSEGRAEIEPGETQLLSWSFKLSSEIKTFELLVYFEDSSSQPLKGWSSREVVNVSEGKKTSNGGSMKLVDDDNDGMRVPEPKVPDPDKK